jgi:hypothetical protein
MGRVLVTVETRGRRRRVWGAIMRALISAAVFAAMSAKPKPRNGGRSLMHSRSRQQEVVHIVRRVLNIILAGGLSSGLLAPPICAASEAVVYSFQGGSDGALPQAGLITNVADRLFGRAGTLYGTTSQGGGTGCTSNPGQPGPGCDTVFEVTPNGVETVLWRRRMRATRDAQISLELFTDLGSSQTLPSRGRPAPTWATAPTQGFCFLFEDATASPDRLLDGLCANAGR